MRPFANPDSPLAVILKGAVAGLLGTVVLTVAMQLVQRTLSDDGTDTENGPGGVDEASGGAPEELAVRVASGVFGTRLSVDARRKLSLGVHWSYGTLWGIAYAVMRASVGLPTWMHATICGLVVWVVGPVTLIPALKLGQPRIGVSAKDRLVSVLLHQTYGWSTAAAFHVLGGRAR